MDKDLAQKAIQTAVCGDWKSALQLNKKILKQNPHDTEALNRLARAYLELGNIRYAKITAKKVLKIDNYNKIAQKCLEKWKGLRKVETITSGKTTADFFIEEPGKTKIISLLYLGANKTLAKLDSGDEVKLNPHGHRISVITPDGGYIGRLPDDISCKLKKLIKMGKEYQILIKSVEGPCVRVFIKEINSSPQAQDIPSFPSEKINYISFTPPELVHKKEDLNPEEEIT